MGGVIFGGFTVGIWTSGGVGFFKGIGVRAGVGVVGVSGVCVGAGVAGVGVSVVLVLIVKTGTGWSGGVRGMKVF